MDKTHAEEIVGTYFDHLVKTGRIEKTDFAVLFGDHSKGAECIDDPIEVVVVSQRFDLDQVGQWRDIIAATWKVDTRIEPFPASKDEWESFMDSPKLARAKRDGKIITVS